MAESNSVVFGSVPVFRGEYSDNVIYYKNNLVTCNNCVFKAASNLFSGVSPIVVHQDGTIELSGTQFWICVVDNVDLYNEALSNHSLSNRISDTESDIQALQSALANINERFGSSDLFNLLSAMEDKTDGQKAKMIPTAKIIEELLGRFVTLSQTEYDILVDTEQIDANTYYFITE